ncbi:NUDIX hydrolase [Haloarcula montana]|uniref:NUDIX hydrolase n=1 Tax=Haloarcula montana TaxID=3111776 RepID=UPI002D7A1549|nr:NUDIX hydrolase [Haloarcula sp. GH36]
MEGVDRAREQVQERLDRLTAGEQSPRVNQETVVTTGDQYRAAIDRSLEGVFRIRVAITNDAGEVLVTPGDDGMGLPCGETDPGEPIDTAARRIARGQAGIDCRPREAVEATIRGIRNEDEPGSDAVYRLSVVYAADAVDPDAASENHRWEPTHAVDAPL